MTDNSERALTFDQLTALRAALTRVTRRLHTASAGSDYTETEMFVLAQVDNDGPLSVKELIAREGLNPSMVSRIIGRLADAGLLRRVPDQSDRRCALLEATALGVEVHKRRCLERNQAFAAAVGLLAPEQVRELLAALSPLQELADILNPAGQRADR